MFINPENSLNGGQLRQSKLFCSHFTGEETGAWSHFPEATLGLAELAFEPGPLCLHVLHPYILLPL